MANNLTPPIHFLSAGFGAGNITNNSVINITNGLYKANGISIVNGNLVLPAGFNYNISITINYSLGLLSSTQFQLNVDQGTITSLVTTNSNNKYVLKGYIIAANNTTDCTIYLNTINLMGSVTLGGDNLISIFV